MAKRVYVGVSANYSEVEYIQSSGTQYIDTGFKPNQNTRVVMDCDLIAQGTVYTPFGTWNEANVGQYICLSYTGMPSALYHGNAYQTGTTSLVGRHTIDANKGVLYLDGRLEATCATATYSCLYPLYLFTMNDKGKPRDMNMSWMKLYSCQIYDNGILVRDYVPCENSSGVGGLYDKVSGQFFANAGTGSFVVGAKNGITYNRSGVARKVRKMYLGIRHVAHKVKKGYIGIGGVARPFFTGGEVVYYGTITPLSLARHTMGGASVGNYALFGGGTAISSGSKADTNTVDAYNKKLTRSTPTALSYKAQGQSAVGVDNYAVFAGGQQSASNGYNNITTTHAYNPSLTRSTATSLSKGRKEMRTARAGAYGLFFGGTYYDNTTGFTTAYNVDAYNGSLTKKTPTALTNVAQAATSVGDYALVYCWGQGGEVVTYNSSLTKTSLGMGQIGSSSWRAPRAMGSATTGKHAIFAGGNEEGTYCDKAYAYDESLTMTMIGSLSVARQSMSCASVGGSAVFAGGQTGSSSSSYSMSVDVYDESLTRKTVASLSGATMYHGVATIGDFALFAGGSPTNSQFNATNVVDAYTV